jgi:hypothetical protein
VVGHVLSVDGRRRPTQGRWARTDGSNGPACTR